ncbi:MAG: DUF5808 domain-containing protein [Vallitaleaceae bacterium]|jgi:uncharacterized membrane protein|nr:DUF5808 domain-containing protein [Vallitaleaceae bacterium]
MTNYILFTNMGTVLFISVLLLIIPYFTRRSISFGVTIPESEKIKNPIKLWEKHYMYFVSLIGIGIVLIMVIVNKISLDNDILMAISIILILVIDFGAYIYYHRKVKLLKLSAHWEVEASNKVVVDMTIRKETTSFQLAWYGLYLVIIGVTVMIPSLIFDSLPAQLAVHFNMEGIADTMMAKEKAIFLLPGSQIGMTLIMFFVHIAINSAKVTIDPGNKEASANRHRIFRKRMALILYFIGLITIITLFVTQLYVVGIIKNPQIIIVVPIVLMLIIFVVLGAFVITTGQSGWKINQHNEPSKKIIRDDDRYYKLGIIYFNPKDPSLFVEKRFGIGWTFNFGNPISWIILVVIILIMVLSGLKG